MFRCVYTAAVWYVYINVTLPVLSLQSLQDLLASEGQLVVLECRVKGVPSLRVDWYRDGTFIEDSPEHRILQKSKLCHTAVILWKVVMFFVLVKRTKEVRCKSTGHDNRWNHEYRLMRQNTETKSSQ